jgi:hypothetical protein
MAAAFHVILYWFGAPVTAVYGRFAVVAPAQTDGLTPRVIVGAAVKVTVNATLLLVQPVVVLVTETVPL